MFQASPLNNTLLDLYGATASISCATLRGMENPRSVEAMLDLMIVKTSNTASTDVLLFGKESAGWWFDYDAGAAGTFTNLGFNVARTVTNVAIKSTTLNYGQRYVLYGRDNGSKVILRVGGSSSGVTDDTALGTLSAITTDANPIVLGVDGAVYTSLKLYEAWVKINGVAVLHWRPKSWMTTLATPILKDKTEFGNDGTVSGTLDTDWRIKSAWTRQPAFSGKENLG